MIEGFGMNFYGFFIYAGAWVVGYFLGALYANRKDNARGEREGTRD
jgi:uncharacterized membrane protein